MAKTTTTGDAPRPGPGSNPAAEDSEGELAFVDQPVAPKKRRHHVPKTAAGRQRIDVWTDKRFGRYRLVCSIGRGTIGTVFRAEDMEHGTDAALKVLRRRASLGLSPEKRQALIEQLNRVAKLEHPGLVKIYQAGQHQGWCYIAMEYLTGGSLAERLNPDQPLSMDWLLKTLTPAVDALGEAHAKRLLHQDLRPANLLLDQNDKAHLTDFGLPLHRLEDINPLDPPSRPELLRLPHYTAPEVLRGHAPSPASDIYALAAVIHHGLTGKPPFEGQTPQQIAQQHMEAAPPDASKLPGSNCPRPLARLLTAAMSKMPDQRPETRSFATLLRKVQATPIRATMPTAEAQQTAEPSNEPAAEREPDAVTGQGPPDRHASDGASVGGDGTSHNTAPEVSSLMAGDKSVMDNTEVSEQALTMDVSQAMVSSNEYSGGPSGNFSAASVSGASVTATELSDTSGAKMPPSLPHERSNAGNSGRTTTGEPFDISAIVPRHLQDWWRSGWMPIAAAACLGVIVLGAAVWGVLWISAGSGPKQSQPPTAQAEPDEEKGGPSGPSSPDPKNSQEIRELAQTAEELLDQLNQMDKGQNFGTQISGAKMVYHHARGFLRRGYPRQAKSSFEKFIERSRQLMAKDELRQRARRLRQAAEAARTDPDRVAKWEATHRVYQRGRDAFLEGQSHFEDQRFEQAGQAWQRAQEAYARAGALTRAMTTREAFEEEKQALRPEFRQVLQEEDWGRVDALTDQAQALEPAQEPQEYQRLYERAQQALQKLRERAQEKIAQQHQRRAQAQFEELQEDLSREILARVPTVDQVIQRLRDILNLDPDHEGAERLKQRYDFVRAVQAGTKDTFTNAVGMRLKYLPAGEYDRGSPMGEPGRVKAMEESHTVRLTQGFFIGMTEVTNRQWRTVMGPDDPIVQRMPPNRPDFPVRGVSWNQARAFCERLSEQNPLGYTYRLPTEAEWEYACRADTETAYSTGAELPLDRANVLGSLKDEQGQPEPRPLAVANFPPNPWGLYDMHGNVSEWCQDVVGPYEFPPYQTIAVDPLKEPSSRSRGRPERVYRGGNFKDPPIDARSAKRRSLTPGSQQEHLGFRVVMEMPKLRAR